MTFNSATTVATNSAKAYFNGVQQGVEDTAGAVPSGIISIHIGCWYDRSLQPNGHINNVVIYPVAKTADEIYELVRDELKAA